MGWSTWYAFGCRKCEKAEDINCMSENAIKNAADLLVTKGFTELGYEYIAMDDCWQSEVRDEKNKLQADAQIFPNGIKNLAAYIHDKDLKLGIFSDLGPKTGSKFPGSEGYFEEDANTFAAWDIDYVKMAAYTASAVNIEEDYIDFGDCLKRTNRPMVYATSWATFTRKIDYRIVAAHCNTWRFATDAQPYWESILATMDEYAEHQSMFRVAHNGAWCNADLLLAGIQGVTLDQAKAQMAVWSIMPSSLILAAHPDNLSSEMEAVLKNGRIIEVNQDPLGIPGYKYQRQGDVDVWLRAITPIAKGYHSYAVAFVNRNKFEEVDYEITLGSIGLDNPNGYSISNLFSTSLSSSSEPSFPTHKFQMRINPSGVVMYKATAMEGNKRAVKPSPNSQTITFYKIHE